MGDKACILFICTANAARSQMAEGCLRARYGERYEAFSAGIIPAGRVTPRAIAVMQEIGIDISGHRSKPLRIFNGVPFDLAVTLCDNVHEVCPVVPFAKNNPGPGAVKGQPPSCSARPPRLAQKGLKVVLVDADLEGAQLGRRLGLATDAGWEKVLAGRVPLAEALIAASPPLTVLPLGRPQAGGNRRRTRSGNRKPPDTVQNI